MKNKKGQIFTIMAIFLIGFVFVSFQVFSISQERAEIKTRVSTMENFLFSIEENLERQVFITGFRTIFLAEDEILTTNQYIPDIHAFFQETFINGTVNGQSKDILIGTTYTDLITSINNKANKINVVVNFSNPVFFVTQEDPWNVKLVLVANFTMEDKTNLAKWEKQQIIEAFVPINGFLDPVYVVNTNSLILNKINRTIYNPIDTNNILAHTQAGYYYNSTEAPSFLNRLQGNLSTDINGIESLVYVPTLSAQGIPTPDKSIVDHIYFGTNNPSATLISGQPSWFKLDAPHKIIYGV